ncbi:VWA domain-containing protein [Psychrobacter okhotskensis]|uniref:VWA domain-containing protein n=1 Tax=Psychrobacter okhotskensis TaxID=212403 RepID=UPI001564CC90|nr:VWA domain-containing protein [Psychrobacter okhotskensis]NRD68981.1 VWA domain-containing protein [Psychrobacter okhotskensis]
MNHLTVGQRAPLSNLAIDDTASITLKFTRQSPIEMDISCFALDAAGKLINDDYMVFYNQPTSPCGQIKLTHYESQLTANKGIQAEFEVNLSKLAANIDSLFFVLSADTPLNQIQSLEIGILQQSQKAQAAYQAADFAQQQASMLMQLYRKGGVWRVSNVAQGFNGGLAAIVQHFGGDVEESSPQVLEPTATPVQAKPSLEKVMLDKAPKLVNLAKKATISLEKRQLQQLTAKVALVLDASGSMNRQYKKGRVQEVVNRILPLAVNFDDDQALDCWAFARDPQYLGEIGLSNYDGFINNAHGGWRKWELGARTNNEAGVMKAVTDFYQNDGLNVPVYILFISDGGVRDTRGITKIMTEAAKLPIFWQFVGLGGRSYGILKDLDDMTGRLLDNCSFFELDDLDDVSEEALYENMLEEFPSWLKEARKIGLIAK